MLVPRSSSVMSRESLCLLKVHAVPSSHVPSQHVRWDTCRAWNKWHTSYTSNVLTLTLQSVCFSLTPISQWERCVYQCLLSGVELLQDLIHDGVGEIGNHRQLHFSEEDWVWSKGEERGLAKRAQSISYLSNPDILLPLLLQSSVNVLCSSFHEGSADRRARDGHTLRDRWEWRT